MRIIGTLASVERGEAGTAVVGDYAASATVLEIANPVDLLTGTEPSTGRVIIGDLDAGDEYDYMLDVEAFTITITPPLVSAVDDGDPVILVPARQTIIAYVALPGGGELVTASVAHSLTASNVFEVNDYADGEGPTVEMERRGDSYVIVDVPGQQVGISTSDTTIATARSGLRTQLDAIGLRTFNADEDETARLSAETGGMRLGGSLEVEGEIRNPHSTEPVDLVLEDGGIGLVDRVTGRALGVVEYWHGSSQSGITVGGDLVGVRAIEEIWIETTKTGGLGGIIHLGNPWTDGRVRVHVPVFILVDPVDPQHATPKSYVDALLTNVPAPTNNPDAANKLYVDTMMNAAVNREYHVGSPITAWSNGNNKITDVSTPTNPNDAANKAYVDANTGGGAPLAYVSVMRNTGHQSVPDPGSASSFHPRVQYTQLVKAVGGLTWDFTNHQFVVPAGMGGTYQARARTSWAGNSSGTRYTTIQVNGTASTNGTPVDQDRQNPTGTGVFTQHAQREVFELADGDVVSVNVYQSSGGNLNLIGNAAGAYLCTFDIRRIGD